MRWFLNSPYSLIEAIDGVFGIVAVYDNSSDDDLWFIKTNSTEGICDYSGDYNCEN